jgi:hypothetical protein
VLKVRLMHSAIRALIELHIQKQFGLSFGQWAYKNGLTDHEHEVPLSQEDQLGALMCFSFVVLEGLPEIGVNLSPEDKDAYIHHWNIVGEALGIRGDLLPRTVAEAHQATAAVWADRAQPGNSDGVMLTRSLLEMWTDQSPDWFDGMLRAVLRRSVGMELAEQMGIEADPFWDAVLMPHWFFRRLMLVGSDLFKLVFGDPVHEVARRLLTVPLNGGEFYQPAAFAIPEALGPERAAPIRMVRHFQLGALANMHKGEQTVRTKMRQMRRKITPVQERAKAGQTTVR